MRLLVGPSVYLLCFCDCVSGLGRLCFGDPRWEFSLKTEMAGRGLLKAQSQNVKVTGTIDFAQG